jgi:putative PIN family toxin of toxin-antitoxin system
MRRKKHRVIIDTNLWISFLLKGDFIVLDVLISEENIVLLFSNELIEEFVEVIRKPKFKKYFTARESELLLQKMHSIAVFVKVTSNIKICRDPKDDFLLSLAVDGLATHLITGDKDLLVLGKFQNTEIIALTDYLFSIQ